MELQERDEHPAEVHRVEINLLLAGIFFSLKFFDRNYHNISSDRLDLRELLTYMQSASSEESVIQFRDFERGIFLLNQNFAPSRALHTT